MKNDFIKVRNGKFIDTIIILSILFFVLHFEIRSYYVISNLFVDLLTNTRREIAVYILSKYDLRNCM